MSRHVQFSHTGGTDVLDIVELPDRRPGDGETRVAVRAAGLNPFDSKVRTGAFPVSLPSGQGAEFAGVVTEVGAGVTDVEIGDEVIGWVNRTAQADFVVVSAHSLAPKPAELSWEAAASLGVVMNTARLAIDAVTPSADDVLYISGIAGAVGMIAAQFALRSGCTVIGTARESNHEFVRSLGATLVTPGDDVVERLRAAAADHPFTAALDTVGRSQVNVALALSIEPARINSIADHDGPADFGTLYVGGGKKTREEMVGYASELANGTLVLPVRATYPFDQVRAAYDELENGHGLGKIVLIVSAGAH